MGVLSYSVRPSTVLKYFGQLCFVLSLLSLVPLTVSLLAGEYRLSLRYGIAAGGILLISAGLMRLPAGKDLQTNEAMTITALIFLFTPFAVLWPMMGSGLGFLDALFESISAVTTTGLSTVPAVAESPRTFLFARAWMQWVGGLGIVVLSLAAMIQPGLVAKRLGDIENEEEDLVGGTRTRARLVSITYLVLTATGILLLVLLGTDGFEAVLYALAAVSTGGFAPQDSSLGGLPGFPSQALVILLSMAGGVSLLLYRRTFREGLRVLAADRQVQGFASAALLSAVLLSLSLGAGSGMEWGEAMRHGALNSLSAQSTAGFSSIRIADVDAGSKLLLILSMSLGGSIGSTAGGIKILRLLILMRLIQLLIQSAAMPANAVAEARLGGRRLKPEEIQSALSLIALFVFVVLVSWVPFLLMGHDPLDALFEVVSAIGTVGLSAGVTGPELHPLLKSVLCADMLLGRLEIFAWLILFYPGTWFGRRMEG